MPWFNWIPRFQFTLAFCCGVICGAIVVTQLTIFDKVRSGGEQTREGIRVKNISAFKELVPRAFEDIAYYDGYSETGVGGIAYRWSGAACVLNSGDGDDRSQIRSSISIGCWIAILPSERDIRLFGAVDDCITDTTMAFNKAVASLPSSGGVIAFPAENTGCYAFASALTIGNGSASASSTRQNVFLKGKASLSGSISTIAANPSVPITFKYTGALQVDVFLTINGPMVWGMDGIQLDCSIAFKCNTGLNTKHMFQSRVENVSIINWLDTGIREDAYPILPSDIYIGASSNIWKNVYVSSTRTSTAGTGWDIGISSCTMPNCFDVSTGNYEDITIQVTDIVGSSSILLRGADNLVFKNVFTFQIANGHIGKNGWGVYVLPPIGNSALPSEIVFIGAPLVGGIFGASKWSCDAHGAKGIVFMPLNEGDMVNPATGGKPIPTTWNGNNCIHGFTSSGSLLDLYQVRMLHGGVQYYGTSTVMRDMETRTAVNISAAVTLSSGLLPATIMRAFNNPDGISSRYSNDRKLQIRSAGVLKNNTGNAQWIEYQLVIGDVSVCSTGALSVPDNPDPVAWTLDATFSIKNGGMTTSFLDTSGKGVYVGGSLAGQFGDCRFELGGPASATKGNMVPGVMTLKSAYDNYAVNMNNAQTLETKIKLQSAATSLAFTQSQLSVELQ